MRLSLARDEALAAVRAARLGEPSTAWAWRILERIRAGEIMPSISKQWAEEVTGQRASREPGEDD